MSETEQNATENTTWEFEGKEYPLFAFDKPVTVADTRDCRRRPSLQLIQPQDRKAGRQSIFIRLRGVSPCERFFDVCQYRGIVNFARESRLK